MDRILAAIRKAEILISVCFMTGIVILVFFAALLRWFGAPVAWSIDVAQLLFGWVVFLGADVALKDDSHIGVDMFVKMLPPSFRRCIALINHAFMYAFLGTICVVGVYLSIENHQRMFNTLSISYSWATASVPAGCLLMLLTMTRKTADLFKARQDAAGTPSRAAW